MQVWYVIWRHLFILLVKKPIYQFRLEREMQQSRVPLLSLEIQSSAFYRLKQFNKRAFYLQKYTLTSALTWSNKQIKCNAACEKLPEHYSTVGYFGLALMFHIEARDSIIWKVLLLFTITTCVLMTQQINLFVHDIARY